MDEEGGRYIKTIRRWSAVVVQTSVCSNESNERAGIEDLNTTPVPPALLCSRHFPRCEYPMGVSSSMTGESPSCSQVSVRRAISRLLSKMYSDMIRALLQTERQFNSKKLTGLQWSGIGLILIKLFWHTPAWCTAVFPCLRFHLGG